MAVSVSATATARGFDRDCHGHGDTCFHYSKRVWLPCDICRHTETKTKHTKEIIDGYLCAVCWLGAMESGSACSCKNNLAAIEECQRLGKKQQQTFLQHPAGHQDRAWSSTDDRCRSMHRRPLSHVTSVSQRSTAQTEGCATIVMASSLHCAARLHHLLLDNHLLRQQVVDHGGIILIENRHDVRLEQENERLRRLEQENERLRHQLCDSRNRSRSPRRHAPPF